MTPTFDKRLIAAQLDGKDLAVLWTVNDAKALDKVAELAGVDMDRLCAAMHRLALRVPGVNWPGGGLPS